MNDLLDNPVYHALSSGDKHLGTGTSKVAAFDEEVSPFAGYEYGYTAAFRELFDFLPRRRHILIATPQDLSEYEGWLLLEKVDGIQMVHQELIPVKPVPVTLQKLEQEHVAEMLALAQLTRPGPFGTRTIEFGHYYGVFEDNKLVAMTGQRMHVQNFSEISAVCTHPAHLGKGYAAALVQQQLRLIYEQGSIPFLHVRADNTRAIDLYKRLGFVTRGPMKFYFMRKKA